MCYAIEARVCSSENELTSSNIRLFYNVVHHPQWEANYTIEKLKNGQCIIKRYFPETKTITQYITFKTDKFKKKHGLFKEYWDDGTLVNRGLFVDNLKEGFWILDTYEKGEFKRIKR